MNRNGTVVADVKGSFRNFCFSNTKTLRDEESMSFPRPFCLVPSADRYCFGAAVAAGAAG
jgi:hypothetical protein